MKDLISLPSLSKHAWITMATTEEERKRCILMAKSLLKVYTTKTLLIFVPSEADQDFKEPLEKLFHLVLPLNKAASFAQIVEKISRCFEKCIFLSSTILFLRNSDNIFNFENDFLLMDEGARSPLIGFRPRALLQREDTPGEFSYCGEDFLLWLTSLGMEEGSKREFLEETFLLQISNDNPTSTIAQNTHMVSVAGMGIGIPAILKNFLTKRIAALDTPMTNLAQFSKEPIAIVGMSCRYAGSTSIDEFWNILISGTDATSTPPPFRWLSEDEGSTPSSRDYNAGFLPERVDSFDRNFFGMSPAELEVLDPQQRLLLQLTYEALEDACLPPSKYKGTNGGIFLGCWLTDFDNILRDLGHSDFFRRYLGTSIGSSAARISSSLGWTGPSIATESGCSSAMVAVHLACQSLLLEETNIALACGVNLLLKPQTYEEMPMMVSPEGKCKTFDISANGFGRAEGGGILVLKRLSTALQDNDRIYALIKGTGVAQEGLSSSLGTPTVYSESLAMTTALTAAGVCPDEVTYVEAHGTGTPVGDPIEIEAICKAYSGKRKEPLLIGSVKTNVGHTESCSGITGIMKVVLALKNEVIPAHINFESLNPALNLDSIPAEIPLQPVPWMRTPDKRRIGGVSSFGITGTDSHVILEEAPDIDGNVDLGLERDLSILKISAKTEQALKDFLTKYERHLETCEETWRDICYTGIVGKEDYPWRVVISAGGREEALQKIREGEIIYKKVNEGGESLKICFLFTGNNSQCPDMGKELYESCPVFQMHFEICSKILLEKYNVDVKSALWCEGKEKINMTVFSQTSIFCLEYALWRLWESWGIKPDFVLGHSLGEFVALTCAGILSLEDALKLVAVRDQFEDLPEGKIFQKYEEVISSIVVRGGHCDFISSITGTILKTNDINSTYWTRHFEDPVNFPMGCKTASTLGSTIFLEIGPSPKLLPLAMSTLEDIPSLKFLPSLKQNESNSRTMLNSLGELYLHGITPNWEGIEGFYSRKKVSLPHYPFQQERSWPKMKSQEKLILHPLLGREIPNPTENAIFQMNLTLSNLPYLKDHVIGTNIIFPGAAFLEMTLAAGLALLKNDKFRPIEVTSLKIKAPLRLPELETIALTTTARNGENDQYSVQIFQNVPSPEGNDWLLHTQAQVGHLHKEWTNVEFTLEEIHFLSKENTSPFYASLATLGLHFGESFQSLKKIWRGDDHLIAEVILPPSENYILHPVLIDSMLQAMLAFSSHLPQEITVPLEVGSFTLLSKPQQGVPLYIKVFPTSKSSILFTPSGTPIAVMSSVEFVTTTIPALEAVLEEQRNPMPSLWEEIWKPKHDLLSYRIDLKTLSDAPFTSNFILETNLMYNEPPPEILQTFHTLENLVYLYTLKTLFHLGWQAPPLDSTFSTQYLLSVLGILPTFSKQVNLYLEILEKNNILQKADLESSWKVAQVPPSLSIVEQELDSDVFQNLYSTFRPSLLVTKMGEKLPQILKGEESPLGILYPDHTSNDSSSAEEFYEEYSTFFGGTKIMLSVHQELFHSWSLTGKVFHILEIGGGTGALTEMLIQIFDKLGIPYDYTFTDISPSFFPKAEARFSKYGGKFHYKVLNIEEDPVQQGFIPQAYDYIYAAEVLHATKDIRQCLQHVRALLRPLGWFGVTEQTKVNTVISFLFGVTEGFWRFEDFTLRKNHCTLEESVWKETLEEEGLHVTGAFNCLQNHHTFFTCRKTEIPLRTPEDRKKRTWIIFQDEKGLSEALALKLESISRHVIRVHPTGHQDKENVLQIKEWEQKDYENLMSSSSLEVEGILYAWGLDSQKTTQEELLRPFFYIVRSLLFLKQSKSPKLIALLSQIAPIGDKDLSGFHPSTFIGFTRSLSNENPDLPCSLIDIGDFEDISKIDILWEEIWKENGEPLVALEGSTFYVPRLHKKKVLDEALHIPKDWKRYQLLLPETKSIRDLKFAPLEIPPHLQRNMIEVEVTAYSLNFRDLMSVLKPSEKFEYLNSLGIDFSGVVNNVGEDVTTVQKGDLIYGAISEGGGLQSHVIVEESQIELVPPFMTPFEASTLHTAFNTAYHSLVEVGKVEKGETILIHTASGGVGLVAIMLAKHLGCKIITTVGSSRKKNYLKSIGIEHVFHSRSVEFSQQILKLTENAGVSLILNSLTSPGFKEASLECLASGGRFIEMSKLSIWTPSQVQELRPDVKYSIVDITDCSGKGKVLREMVSSGIIQPLPYVRFEGEHICQALEHLQKAKHVGKVVIGMRQTKLHLGRRLISTPLFNNRSTYLISGGLGGIGFEVGKWMVENGATYVALLSRSKCSPEMESIIETINLTKNSSLTPIQCDISSEKELKSVLKKISKGNTNLSPNIRGVMHCAGQLKDGFIGSHDTWEEYRIPFNAKVEGSLNLHKATLHLHLEHFVLFSSITAQLGWPGLSNHAAGNSFQDGFSHYRHSLGLPCTSINWGPWAEVGVAKKVDMRGLQGLSNFQGLKVLEYCLKSPTTQTQAVTINLYSALDKLLPRVRNYFEDVTDSSTLEGSYSKITNSNDWIHQYNSITQIEDKLALVKNQVERVLREILKLDQDEPLEDTASFQELGVDSLMFVELKNLLQPLLLDKGVLTTNEIRESNSIFLLSEKIMNVLECGEIKEELSKQDKLNMVSSLIRQDGLLPGHIFSTEKPSPLSSIKIILLTGVTGNLGPYILQDLCSRPQIQQVYCLIRARKEEDLESRLRNVLKTNDLQDMDLSKVTCIEGDTSQVHLGLGSNNWTTLGAKVDAIFHSAAKVDYMEEYKETKSLDNVRSVNVFGTKNILEFAVEGKLKHVYAASSLLSLAKVEDNRVAQGWQDISDFDNVTTLSYPVSKFVGDILFKQGVERGIPCKVFRFPIITGNSQTGNFILEKNHFMLRYFFILKSGLIPDQDFPMQLLPVDICAGISTQMFFREDIPSSVYNISHPASETDKDFEKLANKLGFPLKHVEYSKFWEEILNQSSSGPLSILKEIYKDEDPFSTNYFSVQGGWLHSSEGFFKSEKLSKYCPNFENSLKPAVDYLEKDILFARDQGWFPIIGLKESY